MMPLFAKLDMVKRGMRHEPAKHFQMQLKSI